MSNERLERIKERVNYHGHLDDDIEFLIEQAEKNMTCQEVLELQKDALKGLLEQNKRYREGIKLAMKKTDCDNTWDFLGRLLEGKEETDLPYRIGYKEETE